MYQGKCIRICFSHRNFFILLHHITFWSLIRTSETNISAPDKKGVTGQFRDNFPYFYLQKISGDPSLEPSCQDGFNEGSQDMFSLRNRKKLSLN